MAYVNGFFIHPILKNRQIGLTRLFLMMNPFLLNYLRNLKKGGMNIWKHFKQLKTAKIRKFDKFTPQSY